MSENQSPKKKPIYKKWWFWVVLVIIIIIGAISASQDDNSSRNGASGGIAESKASAVGVGEVLKTQYFDYTVNSVKIDPRVSTGNQYTDLAPEQGNLYLIINTTIKNTDDESRMLPGSGTIWIDSNGKSYEFETAEAIMLEGWGVLMEELNPLTTKTTNLVFKIPSELKGAVYWQPPRARKKEVIALGNIQ